MKPWIIIVASIMGAAAIWFHGNHHGKNSAELRHAQDVAEALQQAIEAERKQQEEVNHALQKQTDDLAAINRMLALDIEQLRQRAKRLPQATRADCQGASGAELSGKDAEFLVREAARADGLRAALQACYRYADTVE